MKRLAPILLVLLVIGLGVVLWKVVYANKKQLAPTRPSVQMEKTPDENPASTPANLVPTNKHPAENPQQKARMDRLAEIKSSANVPILFYGKVVNEFNRPVSGMRVEAAYNAWEIIDILNMRPERFTNVFYSDAAGRFVVSGIKGQSLSLKLEKKGCILAPHSELTFGYGYPSQPPDVSPTNPFIYHVWERQGEANLVRQNFRKSVKADGTSLSLNLQTVRPEIGSPNPEGPTIRVWREPLFFDPQTSRPTNWQYEITWPQGKFQFTDDLFCYFAPEGGYQEKIHKEFSESKPPYSYRETKNFYFINKQGQYGAGSIEIRADYREADAFVAFAIGWNPDGSRNLEPPE